MNADLTVREFFEKENIWLHIIGYGAVVSHSITWLMAARK
jgi:hypothetical protein